MPDSVSSKKQSPSLKARALRLLSQREHSRTELEKKLSDYLRLQAKAERASNAQDRDQENGLADAPALSPEMQIAAVLDDFEKRGWLSDARFAEALVRRRSERYGVRKIKDELQRAGVTSDASAALLDGLKHTEFERAKELFERKFDGIAEDQKMRARQYRFLVSKGFNPEIVAKVIGGRQKGAE
ncbi:MAG: regulatory protein RecX [Polynucleobacter sp.]